MPGVVQHGTDGSTPLGGPRQGVNFGGLVHPGRLESGAVTDLFVDDLAIDWREAFVEPTDDYALRLRVQLDFRPDSIWDASFNNAARETGRTIALRGHFIFVEPVNDSQPAANELKAELDELVRQTNRDAAAMRPKIDALTHWFQNDP
jgi:hypothetical protein